MFEACIKEEVLQVDSLYLELLFSISSSIERESTVYITNKYLCSQCGNLTSVC